MTAIICNDHFWKAHAKNIAALLDSLEELSYLGSRLRLTESLPIKCEP
jgi:hypothetical protein